MLKGLGDDRGPLAYCLLQFASLVFTCFDLDMFNVAQDVLGGWDVLDWGRSFACGGMVGIMRVLLCVYCGSSWLLSLRFIILYIYDFAKVVYLFDAQKIMHVCCGSTYPCS